MMKIDAMLTRREIKALLEARFTEALDEAHHALEAKGMMFAERDRLISALVLELIDPDGDDRLMLGDGMGG